MLFRRNAALWLATLESALALAIGFGVEITTDQSGLIMGAAGAALALVTGAATRSQVYSAESYEHAVTRTDAAFRHGL